MFFVSLVFIQIKSYLQGHWRPFHFFDLFIISIKNLACTLLSASLCTNGTLLSLVEHTTSTPTVGTASGRLALRRGNSFSHLEYVRAWMDMETKSKWSSQPTSYQFTPSWICLTLIEHLLCQVLHQILRKSGRQAGTLLALEEVQFQQGIQMCLASIRVTENRS